ncbi:uncharacterized protein LOC112090233 [Eutrema salsugineum]|uniref:uncharacterized protein LOC112090233 n=1 Tax=Eutrema salsugineum TaxID=72664 RepID=UPI000CED4B2C|nr:uncharacterized protein LOC112090233 [Eutrema salsugineum]
MYSLILHGKSSVELQKWRNLRIAVQNVFSAFSNSFSSASATAHMSLPQDGPKEKIFTKLADSISRIQIPSEGKEDPDSVLSLLRRHGFTDSQIADIVTKCSLLLITDAERSTGPKLRLLYSIGAGSISELIVSLPQDGLKGKTFTVSYLVDSLGLSRERAESITSIISSSEAKGDLDSVLNLLRSYGFTDLRIAYVRC